MAWLRIDDRVRTHPKIVLAGPAAAWFWFCGICYCREHLTDGFIPVGMLASLAPGVTNVKTLAAKLVTVGLWHQNETGFEVHDFLQWNPSRKEVEEKREVDRRRKQPGFPSENSRTDKGIPSIPSRERAAARGSGSKEGSDLRSSLEESPRETTPARRPALITSPLDWHRKHGAIHVTEFCDWVCLPNDLADEFARKVTGTPFDEAREQVIVWAREIRQQWQGRIVPDGSPWDFWKHRWTETHGGSKPQISQAFDPLAGVLAAQKRNRG